MRKVILILAFCSTLIVDLHSQLDSLVEAYSGTEAGVEILDNIQAEFNKIYYQDPRASLERSLVVDSLTHLKQIEEKYGISKIMVAIAYNINELYDEAVRAFLESIEYAEQAGDLKTQAQAFNGLAVVWQVRNDTKTSVQYFEKALDIYEDLNDTLWTGIINLNIGGLYMEDEVLDKAERYLSSSVAAMEAMNQPVYTGYGKLNLGSLRVKQGKYNEAIPLLNAALELVPQQVNPLIHAVAYTALGEAHLRLNRLNESKRFLNRGYELSEKFQNYEQMEVVTALLSEFYERTGDSSNALRFYKKTSTLRDSFLSQEEDQRLVDALKKYEAEKQEKEIMLLSAENEFKDLRIRRERRNLIFALLGLLALLSISAIILMNRNKIKKLNSELGKQKSIISESLSEKELLLKEIHHRVKNNLQVISSLLSLQSNHVQDDSAAQALNLGRDRVKSMALIHQNLYQEGNLTGVKLKTYFEKLCSSLLQSYSINQEDFKLDLDIDDIDLEIDNVISLGLITNELISNSLKHGFKNLEGGNLRVALKESNGVITLSVADNGKGVDLDKISNEADTFGYKMIHAFKDKLEAELTFENKGGLLVNLSFHSDKVRSTYS